jgi:hypothetical protein
MARRVIGIVGAPRPVFEAAMDVIGMQGFDPAQFAVVHLERGAPVPHVDALFSVGGAMPGAIRWESADAADALVALLKPTRQPVEPAAVRRVNTNRIELTAPSDGWLVVSEKMALYPGWSATIKKSRTDLFRADGVLTAVKVRAGDIVRASYEPPRFRLGVGLFVLMLAAVVVAERRTRRRSAPKTAAAVNEISPTERAAYQAV